MASGVCSVGELGFTSFSFTGTGPGTNPIPASAVTVTPVFSGKGDSGVPRSGLSFSSPLFSVTGGQSANYFLNYSIDPHPIIVNFYDVLDTSSPVAPGIASITTALCVGGRFLPSTATSGGCVPEPGSLTTFGASLNVFDNGVTKKLLDTTGTFSRVNFVDVHNNIVLMANGQGGSADFNRFTNLAGYVPDTLVPEPASFIFIGAGLVILWRLRRSRASI